jgi:hypothetical protein
MSRAIVAAPTIAPSSSRTGEMERETSRSWPSLRRRRVSKWWIRSPAESRDRMVSISPCRSSGMSTETYCPTTSSAV